MFSLDEFHRTYETVTTPVTINGQLLNLFTPASIDRFINPDGPATELAERGETERKREAKEGRDGKKSKLDKKHYEKELAKLQLELVRLQEWVRDQQAKVQPVAGGQDQRVAAHTS